MIQFYNSIIYFNYNSGKENDLYQEKKEDGEEENDQGGEADDQVGLMKSIFVTLIFVSSVKFNSGYRY